MKRYANLKILAALTCVFILIGCPKVITINSSDRSSPKLTVTHFDGVKTKTIDYSHAISGIAWTDGLYKSLNIITCKARDEESGVNSVKIITIAITTTCHRRRPDGVQESKAKSFEEDPSINNSSPEENGMVPVELQVTKAFTPRGYLIGRDCGDGFTVFQVNDYQLRCEAVNYNKLLAQETLVVRTPLELPD